jgi:hypothetical protein
VNPNQRLLAAILGGPMDRVPLDPAGFCYAGEEDAERAVRAAFEGGGRRFVLRPTEGPSPRLSEREFRDYMRMIDVWEELSPVA